MVATRRDAAWVARHLGRAVLFRQGTRLSGVWILQTAWVALLATSDAGRGIIAALGPRQCVGDAVLLQDLPAPYSARVVAEGSALFSRQTTSNGFF